MARQGGSYIRKKGAKKPERMAHTADHPDGPRARPAESTPASATPIPAPAPRPEPKKRT